MNCKQITPNNEEPRDRQSRGSIVYSLINPLNDKQRINLMVPNTAKSTPAQATVAAAISSSSPDDLIRARDIAKIRRRLEGAKYRCEHPTGKNAAYAGVPFAFTSPAEGARLLYEKFGALAEGESLDRRDPTGPYSLENLRYARPTLQSVNRHVVLNGWRRRHASP
jgi:hypothetical protein